jgi:hypothetical protein
MVKSRFELMDLYSILYIVQLTKTQLLVRLSTLQRCIF